jgi:hypothetical protein
MSRHHPRVRCGSCFVSGWVEFLCYLLTCEERAAWASEGLAKIEAALAG